MIQSHATVKYLVRRIVHKYPGATIPVSLGCDKSVPSKCRILDHQETLQQLLAASQVSKAAAAQRRAAAAVHTLPKLNDPDNQPGEAWRSVATMVSK